MLLQIPEAASLGLDVFRAVGQSFRQGAQVPVEHAGRGEVNDLLQLAGIQKRQHPFHRHHIHLFGPLGVTPGRGGVNHPVHRGQLLGKTVGVPQVPDQEADAGMVCWNSGEFGRVPQPEQQLGI